MSTSASIAAMQTSKEAQKKKGKKETPPAVTSGDAVTPVPTGANTAEVDTATNGDGPHESLYIRDLQRNVRNVSKKLAAMQKVDSVVAENPGVSLDELVASRKINNDQKAQALKKPSLQAQLAQYEDQIASYRKLEGEFQAQAVNDKEKLQEAHRVEIATLQSRWEGESRITHKKAVRTHLLTLSTFLRAAAARRQVEDDTSEESRAFEGMLLMLYGGDIAAVDAAEKLIYGSDDKVTSTEGHLLNVSYGRVKELSSEVAPPNIHEEVNGETASQEVATTSTDGTAVGTDPTIAHAGLTELDDTKLVPEHEEGHAGPEQAGIDEGAANAAAITNWENNTSSGGDTMQDSWVSVPRPADETETNTGSVAANDANNLGNKAAGWSASGAAVNGTSWADDAADIPSNDGFREVSHHPRGNRGRGADGRGGQDGRGGRGGRSNGRGRGREGGDSRGRGRGGAGRGRGRGGAPGAGAGA